MTRRRKRPKRRRVLLPLLLAALLALLLADNLWVRVREYRLDCTDLPPGFAGLRILQLSDLHGRDGLTGQLLRRAEEAGPDLVFLTGDLADGEGQLEKLRPLLAGLVSLAPTYYVTGNHEWALEDTEGFLRELAGLGVTVLRNSFVTLEKDGGRLIVAGLEDPNGYADMPSPEEVFASIREETDSGVLVLCHRPGLFPRLAKAGYGVVFSGHNHGGLVRLPFLGGLIGPAGFLPEYDAGLFSLGESVMLVSPGLSGSEGVPRLFNRPEVPVAVLYPA